MPFRAELLLKWIYLTIQLIATVHDTRKEYFIHVTSVTNTQREPIATAKIL